MKIVIAICTYQRPEGLERLLRSLTSLEGDNNITVAVADNDAAAEGLAVVERMRAAYPYPLVSTRAEQPGISHSRNAVATLALAQEPELIAFLDDDEWPEPQWLSEMIRVQATCNADAVGGPTVSLFPDDAPAELTQSHYYGAALDVPDGAACQLQAAGNFLIRASTLASLGPQFFHPDFAQSGGEDLAFFMTMAQRGHTMHWATNATVYEPVPKERLTTAWLRERVKIVHNSRVHVMATLQPGLVATLVRLIKTAGLGAYATLYSLAGLVLPTMRLDAASLRWKFIGKLSAHLNLRAARPAGH